MWKFAIAVNSFRPRDTQPRNIKCRAKIKTFFKTKSNLKMGSFTFVEKNKERWKTKKKVTKNVSDPVFF